MADQARKKAAADKLQVVPGLVPDEETARVIHERVRLGIISALAVNESLSFSELKELLQVTDGNLSVHARKLEEIGLIRCSKSFVERTPKTIYRITKKGSKALTIYLEHMEALIRAVRES